MRETHYEMWAIWQALQGFKLRNVLLRYAEYYSTIWNHLPIVSDNYSAVHAIAKVSEVLNEDDIAPELGPSLSYSLGDSFVPNF